MSDSQAGSLSPVEAKSLLEKGNVQLVDVREPSEYASGRIPAARLVPLGTLDQSAQGWDRSQPVLVYCQAGRRGEKARALLTGLGFSSVINLEGGFSAWTAAGLPSEKTAGAPWSLERQVRFTVGVLVILFTSLGLGVHPGFFALDFFIAAGLIFSAVTNTCGMALVLTKMPWNQTRSS
jgi:rhodanese-related sulfurtransferase